MTSIPDLWQVQAVTEDSDWGSAVSPLTVKLMGVEQFRCTPMIESAMLPELRASLAPGYITTVNKVSGQGRGNGALLYDDVPYWLDMLFGTATPVTDTESTRTYTAPLDIYDSDLSTPRIMDIAYGEVTTTDAYQLNGATLQSITFSFENGAPCTWDAQFIGKEVVEGTLAGLSDRSVSVVMGDHVSLWIDPSSDSPGTTAIATTAFMAELQINTNRDLYWQLGSLTPSGYRDAKWDATLRLRLELNATSRAYMSGILGTPGTTFEKVVRIKAASGVNSLQFDFTGATLSVPEIMDDQDGVSVLEFELMGKYGEGLANFLAAESINTVSSLA